MRRRLDEAALFGRVARIEYPFTEEHITRTFGVRSQSTKAGLTTNGRAFYSVTRPTSALVLKVMYGFNVPKMQPILSQYMVQGQTNFAPKIGIWACFCSQGVGELRIFDEKMDTRLYTDTMQRFMKPCALRFWPSGAWFYLQDNAAYHKLSWLSGLVSQQWSEFGRAPAPLA